jgi:hypothetical protein
LFLAWVCFSLAFSTVFQAFLTTFLIDSGIKKPIQNMGEPFASGIKLAYLQSYDFLFENGDETEASKVRRVHAKGSLVFLFVWTGQSIRRMCQYC